MLILVARGEGECVLCDVCVVVCVACVCRLGVARKMWCLGWQVVGLCQAEFYRLELNKHYV